MYSVHRKLLQNMLNAYCQMFLTVSESYTGSYRTRIRIRTKSVSIDIESVYDRSNLIEI